jgi:putative effector of murein hydrolase LrgA (UPF0299 family)
MASAWIIAIVVAGVLVVTVIFGWIHEALAHLLESRVARPRRGRSKRSTQDR